MAEVLVRGRAEGHLAPDTAVLTITVVGRDPGPPAAAMAAAAEVGDRVDALVEERRGGDAALVRRVRVTSVRVTEMWEHPQGRAHRTGFQAHRRSELECAADGPGLTDLVAALTAAGAQVSGPVWRVDPSNAGWADLRSRAVADARARAEVYAAAAGSALARVAWLAEPGLRTGGGQGGGVAPMARMAAFRGEAAGDGEPVAVRIAVEDVPAEVEIEVAFGLA